MLDVGCWSASLLNRRLPDEIQAWEIFFQIGVALRLDQVWPRAVAARIAFAITAIELFDYVHAAYDFSEWRESGAVKAGVVHQVDEHLRGARLRTRHGEADAALGVALFHRIVHEGRHAPQRLHLGIAGDSELHHESGDHAEEPGAVEEAGLRQLIEAVRSQRGPILMYLQND